MTTTQELLASGSWRRRNSLWVYSTIAGCGMFAWAAFLYAGLKTKQRKLLIAAFVYAVLAGVSFALISIDGPKEVDEPTTLLGNIATSLLIAVWVATIVHAFSVKREWLTRKAEIDAAGPWYEQGGQSPAQSFPAHVPDPMVDDVLRGTASPTQWPSPVATQPAPPPVSSPPPPPPPPVYSTPGPPPRPPTTHAPSPLPPPPSSQPAAPSHMDYTTGQAAQMLDLNTVTSADLMTQLGLDQAVAERVIGERNRIGRFTDVEQLMIIPGVEPHVFAAIRYRVVITQAPAAQRPSSGRRLDL
ncbi:MAG TPA: helix-hairpin-helix domain-containing protein [Microthrixaceae bacterium]|nr:helix-hairpin-helix domain-containing protein [Microthrixaceae bacterium]